MNRNKIFSILIIIIACLIVCCFLINKKTGVSETNDWEKYINNTYGFEFKYPKDWVVDSRYSIIKIVSPEWQKTIEDGKNSEYSIYYQDNTCAYCYNISIYPILIDKTLDEYISENKNSFSGSQKINFNGISGYKVTELGDLTIDGILVKNGNYLFDIGLVPGDKSEAIIKTENQILSSFKFLNK